mmetsp:Transcript_16370/g.27446  ORF Transcript_16370/g.27446 Transcript_16370/m.27446 type:complete len:85 (+) Transcript_16370:380-634(+)
MLKNRNQIPDAILTDYELPDMNGAQMITSLRSRDCKCFIVSLMVSMLQEDVDNFKIKGADAVLPKPLNVDLFQTLMESFKPVTI